MSFVSQAGGALLWYCTPDVKVEHVPKRPRGHAPNAEPNAAPAVEPIVAPAVEPSVAPNTKNANGSSLEKFTAGVICEIWKKQQNGGE